MLRATIKGAPLIVRDYSKIFKLGYFIGGNLMEDAGTFVPFCQRLILQN